MAIRISKVYTRSGDSGSTRLAYGQKVSKASARVVAYGSTDELGSHIGYLCALLDSRELVEKLQRIQQELFDVGALLATDPENYQEGRADIPEGFVSRLESEIDGWNEQLDELKSFILAGGGAAGAYCHVCRTVARRCEQNLVHLLELDGQESVPVNCLKYVNRLSDYLFVLARYIARDAGESEILWDPGRTAL